MCQPPIASGVIHDLSGYPVRFLQSAHLCYTQLDYATLRRPGAIRTLADLHG
jgi:hypothetical protein